jgi:heme-degrading monooxygenase HmoA
MIARIWHGKTTSARADACTEGYFIQTGLADYQAAEGNRGVVVLRKDENGQADFLMLTRWDSDDAIKKLAGDDINQARYYPEDKKYFDEMEPHVVQYQVLIHETNL